MMHFYFSTKERETWHHNENEQWSGDRFQLRSSVNGVIPKVQYPPLIIQHIYIYIYAGIFKLISITQYTDADNKWIIYTYTEI